MSSLIQTPSGPFEPPTILYHLATRPLHFVVSYAHKLLNRLRGPPHRPVSHPIRIVCLSDTHTHTLPIPDGDILIHAGDLGVTGTRSELQAQINWLASLPHPHKLVVCGNHDGFLDPRSRRVLGEASAAPLDWRGITYLQHSATTIRVTPRGPAAAAKEARASERVLKVYGAPQIPACGGADNAFQYVRGQDAWSETVPADADVLVTHTPAKWHRDLPWGQGCEWLLHEMWRVRPRLHVCGHVHGGRGSEDVYWDGAESAYERVCDGAQGWSGMMSPRMWFDALRVLGYGLSGVLWNRVFGGESVGTTVVNAGVIDWPGKKIIHEPIVVDL